MIFVVLLSAYDPNFHQEKALHKRDVIIIISSIAAIAFFKDCSSLRIVARKRVKRVRFQRTPPY